MWRKLLFIPPLAIGIALVAFIVGNRPAPARKAQVEEARAVRVLTIKPQTLRPAIRGYGTVRPDRVWSAIAQVGGKVIFIHPRLKKGAIIAEGEEIVTIAPDDYKLAISQAETAIRTARAKLSELDVTEQNTRRLLELERQALHIAEKDFERKKTLKAQGTIPATLYEQALRALIAQRKLVANMENALRLIPVQRKELEQQLASYRLQLATAKLNLARTHIRMPFTGRISQVAAEVGQFAPVGRQLAAADSIAAAEVEAQYPLQRMRSVISLVSGRPADVALSARSGRELARRLGLSVRVRLESGGEPVVWKGRFARLSDSVDAKTRTIGVIGVVERPYDHVVPGLRPPLSKGMFVRMDILTRPVENAIVIPRAALRGGKVFLAGADGRLEVRPVRVAAKLGSLAVISEGLKGGERLVLSDVVPALSGQLLSVTEDDAAARALAAEASGGEAQ